jgi:hypothetical protein
VKKAPSFELRNLVGPATAWASVAFLWITVARSQSFSFHWMLLATLVAGIYGYVTCQDGLVAAMGYMPLVCLLALMALSAMTPLIPYTIDSALLHLDRGSSITFWHWCLAHPASYLLIRPVYVALGPAMVLGITFTRQRTRLIRALLLALIAGLACYYLFPAVGPKWVGQAGRVRNCMPSLHFAWALLLWIYANEYIRWPMFLFAVLTPIAAVGIGEHYVVDMVAAVPFTAGIIWLNSLFDIRLRAAAPNPPQPEQAGS